VTLALAGLGTAVPDHSLTQEEAVELHTAICGIDAERSRTLRAVYRRSGVRRRHSVVLGTSDGPLHERQEFYEAVADDSDLGPTTARRMRAYEDHAPGLAIAATRAALHDADVEPLDVSHVVTVSCTGFIAPGLDVRIIQALGMRPTTQRTHVGFMGCHGALNGLRVAQSLVDAEPDALAIVCSVELCSLHFAYGWQPEMMVANALFADGAAAVVGRAAVTDDAPWRLGATATVRLPDSEDDMSWRIGDHGFRMTLSARVPDRIAGCLGDWLTDWLASQGLGVEDVGSWAVHPGGPRIVSAVEQALGLAKEVTAPSRSVLADFGNMSSATVLFILERLRAAKAPRPCVALALGPGLVAEAALIL
jgi:predicted naringenin-chalcone synthase